MKRFIVAALCLLLVLALAACGSGKSLAGTYVLSSIAYADDLVLSQEDLQAEYDALGVSLDDTYLELYDDGTGLLCLYGLSMPIAYADGKLWYTDSLDLDIDDLDELEFDEDGQPIESTEAQAATEATVSEDMKIPFTVDGNRISLDPDGLGEVFTFTKK